MKLLPLWGMDGKTAMHGLIDNLLQSQVDEKIQNTKSQRDIVGIFIPLLKAFVKGARTKHPSRADLITASESMLSMSTYFEAHDYNKTWKSKEVEIAWIEAWLCSYDNNPNILDTSEYFEIERPTMTDFKSALDLYMCKSIIYLFLPTHTPVKSAFNIPSSPCCQLTTLQAISSSTPCSCHKIRRTAHGFFKVPITESVVCSEWYLNIAKEPHSVYGIMPSCGENRV